MKKGNENLAYGAPRDAMPPAAFGKASKQRKNLVLRVARDVGRTSMVPPTASA
jgi:hypothetical protein